jgi:hypothetical protein
MKIVLQRERHGSNLHRGISSTGVVRLPNYFFPQREALPRRLIKLFAKAGMDVMRVTKLNQIFRNAHCRCCGATAYAAPCAVASPYPYARPACGYYHVRLVTE